MNAVLLIEDREGLRQLYADFLKGLGFQVVEAASAEEARHALERQEFALILADYLLPGVNGLEFLKEVKSRDPDALAIIMTAFGEVKLAVEAMKAGAFDFLEKPIDLDHLELVLNRALSHRKLLRDQSIRAQRDEAGGTRIVGSSEALREALTLADKAAPAEANCLLLGESGVGKELFARYIHERSPRKNGPLVAVNCASIPGELIESELFGHERGAFTGAVGKKLGLIDMADGGALFLDEIGELPLALQPKLLRVIQTHEYFRVGGARALKSDIRLICATNRDLAEGVASGWFREDLYYRLAVFPIRIPPLRERKEDIPELIALFLERLGYAHGPLDGALMKALCAYAWPGNVRELENALERALILSQGRPLDKACFPAEAIRAPGRAALRLEVDLGKTLKDNLAALEPELEANLIRLWLREEEGHRERVAARAGFSVKTLYNKLKQYGLDADNP